MNETNSEQKTKKDNGKTIVIFILVILLLGALGYIIYDKIIASENENDTQSEQKLETPKEDLDAIGTKLLSKINENSIDILDYYEKKLEVSSIPTNEQMNAFFENFFKFDTDKNTWVFNVTKAETDAYFKDVYGITLTSYPDIVCDIDNNPIATYNNSTNSYELTGEHGHGGASVNSISQIITNIKKDSDNYILDVAKLYMPPATNGDGIYGDGNFKTKLQEFDRFYEESGDFDENSAIKYFQDNKEYYKQNNPIYRYTFKKDNDNYYIVKYEIIK